MTARPMPLEWPDVASPADVTPVTLLGVCMSLKPAPGVAGRSATRNLLCYALRAVAEVYPAVRLLDLRRHPLPWFDGRKPADLGVPSVKLWLEAVGRAGALLISVPAYWSGSSGAFKNAVDVLCGPLYTLTPPVRTVFTDKEIGLIVVGADPRSARYGAEDAARVLEHAGAAVRGRPVVVERPGNLANDSWEAARLARELVELAASTAQAAAKAVGG